MGLYLIQLVAVAACLFKVQNLLNQNKAILTKSMFMVRKKMLLLGDLLR